MDVPSAIFTPEHDELRAAVRRFVDKELAPSVDEWEAAGYFPDWVFRRCGELGFLGLHYPERWGGAGGDLAAEIVFIEELFEIETDDRLVFRDHDACGIRHGRAP